MTEFGILIEVGRSIFLGVNHVPIPRERAQHLQNFVPKRFDQQRRNLVWQHVWPRSVLIGGQPCSSLMGAGPCHGMYVLQSPMYHQQIALLVLRKNWDVIDLSISYGSRDINFKIWAQIFANLETPVDQGDIPGSTGVKVYTRRTTPGLSISFTLTIQKFALAQRCCCVATDRDRQKCLSRSQPTGPGGWIGLYVQTRG